MTESQPSDLVSATTMVASAADENSLLTVADDTELVGDGSKVRNASRTEILGESAWQTLFEQKRRMFEEAGYGLSLRVDSEELFRRSLEANAQAYSSTPFARIIQKLNPAFDHIKSFATAIGAIAQAQPFASIAWGGLNAIVECGCKFGEALDSIADLLESLGNSIPIFDVNLALFPNADILQYPLRSIFTEYCDFCLFTIKYFKKGASFRVLQGVVTSTPQKRLKDTKKRITELTANFHHELEAVNRAAARQNQLHTNMLIGRLSDLSTHALNTNLTFPRPENITTGVGRMSIEPATNVPLAIEAPATRGVVKINTPASNPEFLGRESVLTKLHHRLWPISTGPLLISCALHGMGGVGKTQTAVQYVHQYGDQFDKIIWVRAEDGPERIRDFCLINRKIEGNASNDTESARDWLETTDKTWLLVFDNVERFEDIAGLWPNSSAGHGSIIITTRTDRLSPRVTSRLSIDPMDQKDGIQLLFHYLEQPKTDSDDVQRILEIAGGLPLIITIVGTYIRRIKRSLADFIQIYDESPAVLWTGRGWEQLWQYENRNEPGKVFLIALTKLPADARKLIEILAFLNPDAVPEEFLSVPTEDPSLQFLRKPRHNLEDMIYDLTKSSLIKRDFDLKTGKRSLSIHRLLQDYLVYSLSTDATADSGPKPQLPDAFDLAFKLVRQVTPAATTRMQPTRHDRAAYEKALPQILSLAAVYKRLNLEGTLDFANLLSDAGMYMWADGLTKDGLQLLKAAEGVLDRINYEGESLTRSRINTVISILNDNVGISQRKEGLERRESALKDRIAYQERTPALEFTQEDDILLHNAWADLACSHLQFHRWKDAEKIWEKCLEKYKSWGPPEKEGMAYEYSKYNHHMAFVRLYQRRFDDALVLSDLGVKYMIDSLGKEHPLVWRYKYDHACILLQAGKKEDSLALQTEVLTVRTQLLGRSSELTIQSCYTVGALYDYCGDKSEAEIWMKEAIHRQNVGKSFWPEELQAIVGFHLSRVLNAMQKEPEKAEELRGRALQIKERLLKMDLPPELEHADDEMVWFEHMLPVFNGRFAGVALLPHITGC